MKWLVVLLSLTGTAQALACPPPPPGYQPPSAEESLRYRVTSAPNIVYAVVERSIREERRAAARPEPGRIRILHVYKGNLRRGQRIPIYGLSVETDCGNIDYSRSDARRGAYGRLLLQAWDGRQAMPFVSFESRATVEDMIRLGLIASARAGRSVPPPDRPR